MESSVLRLLMVQGPRQGETLEFQPGAMIRIGRIVRGNNLPIKDVGISTNHLCIEFQFNSGKWAIRDLESSNGTILNRINLSPNTAFDLHDGDSVKIGEETSILIKIDCRVESQLRRNPRRRAAGKDGILADAESRGRALKATTVEHEVQGENVMVLESKRRGRPRKGRALKNENADDAEDKKSVFMGDSLNAGPVEGKLDGKMNTRSNWVVQDDEGVVVKSISCKIPENKRLEGGKVGVGVKRTRAGAKKRNDLQDESSDSVKVDVLEDNKYVGPKNFGKVALKDAIEEMENKNGEVSVKRTRAGARKRRYLSEKPSDNVKVNVLEDNKCIERKNLSKVTLKDAMEGIENKNGRVSVIGSDVRKPDENEGPCSVLDGSVNVEIGRKTDVKENKGAEKLDLEKMTIGEWFDYLEVYLPTQIIDETEEIIECMKIKAARVREHVLQQKNEKEKVSLV